MKIGSIFVLYNPEPIQTKQAIGSLVCQVDHICVVDNGSFNINTIENYLSEYDNVHLIKLRENTGIAHALNVGLKELSECNCDFILTSDQDSIYPSDFINDFYRLLSEYGDYSNVAAFSTSYYDEYSQRSSKVLVMSRLFYKVVTPVVRFTNVIGAITSGMIINVNNLQAVGLMDEELFIDWVDNEWCFRAIAQGFDIIHIKEMLFIHHLGESSSKVLWKTVPIRSAERYYYIVRNAFYLVAHSPYISAGIRFSILKKGFKDICGYTIIKGNHIKNSVYCMQGMIDGISSRMGQRN